MKTFGELESENPEDFRNPTRTPEQEAALQKMYEQRKATEAAPTESDDEESDETESDDDMENE